MTDAEQMACVAEVQARVACALIRMEGMKAENAQRELCGASMAYGADAFDSLIDQEGIGTNAVILTLRHNSD